ncbi:hypothetical protein HYH03_012080 [Edaphochlamys debaryana]|uniref:MYND-type domain-containing protein n=1 Tax=Edaphochlamys debaryana TaxID=47281 RepID=A0A836BVW0_9CHLO|nr:hypothetical protein HYH03_012080 [Edaphochlamys debaryana]|eukprot:KAG2489444.1 hypothetical protein HYH03_012080 [Edaphochlamys debaryana]
MPPRRAGGDDHPTVIKSAMAAIAAQLPRILTAYRAGRSLPIEVDERLFDAIHGLSDLVQDGPWTLQATSAALRGTLTTPLLELAAYSLARARGSDRSPTDLHAHLGGSVISIYAFCLCKPLPRDVDEAARDVWGRLLRMGVLRHCARVLLETKRECDVELRAGRAPAATQAAERRNRKHLELARVRMQEGGERSQQACGIVRVLLGYLERQEKAEAERRLAEEAAGAFELGAGAVEALFKAAGLPVTRTDQGAGGSGSGGASSSRPTGGSGAGAAGAGPPSAAELRRLLVGELAASRILDRAAGGALSWYEGIGLGIFVPSKSGLPLEVAQDLCLALQRTTRLSAAHLPDGRRAAAAAGPSGAQAGPSGAQAAGAQARKEGRQGAGSSGGSASGAAAAGQGRGGAAAEAQAEGEGGEGGVSPPLPGPPLQYFVFALTVRSLAAARLGGGAPSVDLPPPGAAAGPGGSRAGGGGGGGGGGSRRPNRSAGSGSNPAAAAASTVAIVPASARENMFGLIPGLAAGVPIMMAEDEPYRLDDAPIVCTIQVVEWAMNQMLYDTDESPAVLPHPAAAAGRRSWPLILSPAACVELMCRIAMLAAGSDPSNPDELTRMQIKASATWRVAVTALDSARRLWTGPLADARLRHDSSTTSAAAVASTSAATSTPRPPPPLPPSYWRGVAAALALQGPLPILELDMAEEGAAGGGASASNVFCAALANTLRVPQPPVKDAEAARVAYAWMAPALSAGLLPSLELFLRRREPARLQVGLLALARDRPGGPLDPYLLHVLAFGGAFADLREAAGFVVTLSKLATLAADEGAEPLTWNGPSSAEVGLDCMSAGLLAIISRGHTVISALGAAFPGPQPQLRPPKPLGSSAQAGGGGGRGGGGAGAGAGGAGGWDAVLRARLCVSLAFHRWLPAAARALAALRGQQPFPDMSYVTDGAGVAAEAAAAALLAVDLAGRRRQAGSATAVGTAAAAAAAMGPGGPVLGASSEAAERSWRTWLWRDVNAVGLMGSVLCVLRTLPPPAKAPPECVTRVLRALRVFVRAAPDQLATALADASRDPNSPWTQANLASVCALAATEAGAALAVEVTEALRSLRAAKVVPEPVLLDPDDDFLVRRLWPLAAEVLVSPAEVAAAEVLAVGCSNPQCLGVKGDTEASTPGLSRCGGCKTARYCNSKCQAAHWKAGHKEACGSARASGAEGSGCGKSG